MTLKHSKQVLIVTESPSFQAGLLALLTAVPGANAVCDHDARSATRNIADFDLILLDMSIQERNVLKLLQQLRTGNIATRTIVFSDDVQQRGLAVEAGADLALLKGYPAAQLVKIIEDQLGNQ